MVMNCTYLKLMVMYMFIRGNRLNLLVSRDFDLHHFERKINASAHKFSEL